MKESLLKWAHHLNKGTTWGYATRKDCLVVVGFSCILFIAYVFLYCLIGLVVLNVQWDILKEYLKFTFLIFNISVIIADISLMFMRINDMSGKRCFITKGHIFAFLGIYFLITEGFDGNGILETVFDIKPIIDFKGLLGLLLWLILCVYPSSSKEREEMPVVEYKLPTEFIIFLSFVIIVVSGLLLHNVTKVTEVTESKVEAAETEYGTITDERDDKVYKTVKIGRQTWMAENLNYSGVGRIGKCYEDDPSNCEIYGRLYDWDAAVKACPRGWHLPSYDEWDTLYQFIGGENYFSHKVESKLKAESGWEEDGALNNGTDDYRFTALPGGLSAYFFPDKIQKFEMLGRKGSWWTATQESYDEPKGWFIDWAPLHLDRTALMSVRCVKD